MTGARYIIGFLERQGVDTLFGYPGAALLELYDALRESKIRYIQACHEQGAVHAAVGYAKASGKIGVCIATSGPGATNLVTGIADARLDSTPLLVITGQVDSAVIGRDAFQEADIMGITIPVTKHNMLIKNPDTLAPSLSEAWNIAGDKRAGPVLVDIAHNVLAGDFPYADEKGILPRARKSAYPLSDVLGEIKKVLSSAKRPVILCGGGVVSGGASDSLSEFAEKTKMPIVCTMMGKGALLGTESLGMCGCYGNSAANMVLRESDLCIAVGTRFSDRTVGDFAEFSRGKTIVHCDIDASELSKNVRADIAVECSAKDFFKALSSLKLPRFEEYSAKCLAYKKNTVPENKENVLSCGEILSEINAALLSRRDGIYVTDVGAHQTEAAKRIDTVFERGFIVSGGLGAMGFGLPAAIGASFSADDRVKNIVLICGDGGFQMTVEELSLLHTAGRAIKVFIMDNGGLGMIRDLQNENFGGRHFGCENTFTPDFVKLAEAYSLPHTVLDVSNRPTLSKNIQRILDADGSMIVVCKING